MVKFEFTLSDEDAENLFMCIRSAMANTEYLIGGEWANIPLDSGKISALVTTREYLGELQAKLLHERVDGPFVVRNPKTGTLELTSAGDEYRKQIEHNERPKDWPPGCPWPPE